MGYYTSMLFSAVKDWYGDLFKSPIVDKEVWGRPLKDMTPPPPSPFTVTVLPTFYTMRETPFVFRERTVVLNALWRLGCCAVAYDKSDRRVINLARAFVLNIPAAQVESRHHKRQGRDFDNYCATYLAERIAAVLHFAGYNQAQTGHFSAEILAWLRKPHREFDVTTRETIDYWSKYQHEKLQSFISAMHWWDGTVMRYYQNPMFGEDSLALLDYALSKAAQLRDCRSTLRYYGYAVINSTKTPQFCSMLRFDNSGTA